MFLPNHETKQLYFLSSDAREVFDLFDFWDGRDGEVDAFKLGDLLRCLNINPTCATVAKHGGTLKMGKTNKTYFSGRFFRIFEILIFCFVVAICDLVHAVEAMCGLT